MPEGPEVKVVTNQLNKLLKNTYLKNIQIIKGPFQNFKKSLNKNLSKYFNHKVIKIKEVLCKGKFIYFVLIIPVNHSYQYLYIGHHLGMTGQWLTNPQDAKHILITLNYFKKYHGKLTENIIYYNDARHFGKFTLLNKEQLDKKLNSLGPDVLNNFSQNVFVKLLKNPNIQNKLIVNVLNNQKIISGLGNYLRADILYTAKVSPKKKVHELTNLEIIRIYKAIKKISMKSYLENGTNFGRYDPLIYEKKKAPNGKTIKTFISLGRTIYYVD